MSTASSAGHEEGKAWLPLVVDCGVCETTHALAIGDPRGCPFEGSHRASPAPGRPQPIPITDSAAGTTSRLTGLFLR
jgi:hypothetical protein